ncbi:MAG: formylglycine-generating enzyme family protein [Saprospiraceae bacterium]|nr:formylglycine-generating enzyme family protein [Saprospiraceae bacterium]
MPDLLTITLYSGLTFDLVYVEGGEFMMGDEVGDLSEGCRPVHSVRVSSYYLSKYPVTQQLWQVVMKNNPSLYKGENRPVDTVSWLDTQDFIETLNRIEWRGNPGTEGKFRLPTEAEWEYAARGGRYSQRQLELGNDYLYVGSDRLGQVGWFKDNSNVTRKVGLLLPNELGLQDMSGNIWEWCKDWFGEVYYKEYGQNHIVTDPKGPLLGDDRVMRGGSIGNGARGCRLAYRGRNLPNYRANSTGFRLVFAPQSNAFPDTREQKGPEAIKQK